MPQRRSLTAAKVTLICPSGMPLVHRQAGAGGLLLEGDHVRPAQCRGFSPQRLVCQVRIARIQDIIETDSRLVVAASRGRIHGDDDRIIVRHGSDRRGDTLWPLFFLSPLLPFLLPFPLLLSLSIFFLPPLAPLALFCHVLTGSPDYVKNGRHDEHPNRETKAPACSQGFRAGVVCGWMGGSDALRK